MSEAKKNDKAESEYDEDVKETLRLVHDDVDERNRAYYRMNGLVYVRSYVRHGPEQWKTKPPKPPAPPVRKVLEEHGKKLKAGKVTVALKVLAPKVVV